MRVGTIVAVMVRRAEERGIESGSAHHLVRNALTPFMAGVDDDFPPDRLLEVMRARVAADRNHRALDPRYPYVYPDDVDVTLVELFEIGKLLIVARGA